MSELSGEETADEIEARLLLEAIYRRYHYDFRGYAESSMRRRLYRAQQHFGCHSLSQLQDQLLRDPGMLAEMLGFLTVQVSEMFRDPSFFRSLRENVVPHLRTYPSLKVWVAGCGDGEELYSLAILFREEGLESRTIFYATDISPTALRRAEAGVYGLDRLQLFTTNHRMSGAKTSLSEYYSAAYGAAVFDRSLRARTVFSQHNLATDQVFAEVHLVTCRNVLIYFDRALQDRTLALFRDSLVRGGFLGLGSGETPRFSAEAGSFPDFDSVERVYRRALTLTERETALGRD